MFKIKLNSPFPEDVKISSKNVCIVTIVKGEDEEKEIDGQQKILQYYLSQKEETFGSQFKKAVMLGPQIDEDNLIINDVSLTEALVHFVAITWKVIFSLVPPPHIWNGMAAFIVALMFIGICTGIVEQFATLLGCELSIDDSITAITLVAIGTSLPDTFASMSAAKSSETADSAIGNITGSNSVNVFLGLGLPWVIGAMYFNVNLPNQQYKVPAGSLSFSVYVFLVVAILCFIILIVRRFVSPIIVFGSNHVCFVGHRWRARRPQADEVH